MSMSVRVITPPAETPVSLDEAKAHLRVEWNDEDDYVQSLVEASTQAIDATGWLGRSLLTQTLELAIDGSDAACSQIDLPFRPIQSIVSVKYDDASGVEQTLDASTYSLASSKLVFTGTQPWWSTCTPVRIRYIAGYGSDASSVPAPIKHAIKLLIGHLFQNREIVTDGRGNQPFEVPQAFESLLSPYRVYR